MIGGVECVGVVTAANPGQRWMGGGARVTGRWKRQPITDGNENEEETEGKNKHTTIQNTHTSGEGRNID